MKRDIFDKPVTCPGEATELAAHAFSRRGLMLGTAGLAAGAGSVLGGGAPQAQGADGTFPNHFKWDQPIFPNVTPKFTMKIGHQGPPNVFVSGEHVQTVIMKNIVERGSNGEVQVQIFPSGSLGNAVEMLEQTRAGIIQACIQESAVPTVYRPIQVFSIPYLFRTHSIAWSVMDSDFASDFFRQMAETSGLDVVGVGENGGFRCFTNSRRPIREPGDLKGLKIRVQEHEGQIAMIKAMGAAATPLPWAELYTSLQTRVVDGQENAVPTISFGKLYEVQSYLTLDNHIYGAHYLLANAAWLKGLPKEHQALVREGGRQAAVASRGLNRILEWEVLARLGASFKEIYVPTAEQMTAFRNSAQPAYLDWFKANVDRQGELFAKISAAVEAAERRAT